MWLLFLIHNHWIYPSLDDAGNIKWITTDKGMEWLEVIEDKFKDLLHVGSSLACFESLFMPCSWPFSSSFPELMSYVEKGPSFWTFTHASDP